MILRTGLFKVGTMIAKQMALCNAASGSARLKAHAKLEGMYSVLDAMQISFALTREADGYYRLLDIEGFQWEIAGGDYGKCD